MKDKIKSFLKEWKEFWVVPILITLFLTFPYLQKDSIDTQAGWSFIYLQKLLWALTVIVTANASAWFVIKLDYLKDELNQWQSIVLYSVLVFSFVLALIAL